MYFHILYVNILALMEGNVPVCILPPEVFGGAVPVHMWNSVLDTVLDTGMDRRIAGGGDDDDSH